MSFIENFISDILKNIFTKNPLAATYFYAFLGMVTSVLMLWGFKEYLSYQRYGDEPRTLNFRDAAEYTGTGTRWVTLWGMQKKCDQSYREKEEYVIPLVDADNTSLVLYTPAHGIDICNLSASEPVTGRFEKIGTTLYKSYQKKQFDIVNSYAKADIWTMCAGCKTSDPLTAVYLFAGLSLFFYGIAYMFYCMHRKKCT